LCRSGLRALQRTQATREKAEAAMHPAAMERAGWWFRDASVPAAPASPVAAEPVRPVAPQHPAEPPDPSPVGAAFSDLTDAEQ
jgi:hypothetical protein